MAIKKKAKTTKKTVHKRTTHKTTHSHNHIVLLPFSFRRIVLVSTAFALFLVAVVLFNKNDVNKAVAGLSITRGLYTQAVVSLPDVPDAASYTLYYKKASSDEYANTAWGIPANNSTYTISYLKKGDEYKYKIAAVDASGAEFYWTEEQDLTNIEPME